MRQVGVVLLVLMLVFGCSRNGPQADASACADPREEGVDLLKGHVYLVLLTRRHPTGEQAGWSAMDVMGFDDEVVGRGPEQCWPAGSRLAREELWSLDGSRVRQVMTTTQPDPLAARYADLDPGERHQRIAAERG